MLQKASDDGDHAHVVGVALHAGDQARNAAHQQGDRHARLARLGQLHDDLLVGDAVGLEEQAARLALARQRDLLVDPRDDGRLDLQRGHPQDVVVVGGVLQLHVAEELRGVAPDGLVGGDEGQVGVELRRLLVVVAGAKLRDVLQPVFRLARDAADLAVHLVIAETVDDVAAGLLEALRPLDVVRLVEARAQLEQSRDLLAVFGGRDQGFRQVRLACQAVQRDLDGDDARVVGGFPQKLHESVHGLVGVGQEHLTLGHLADDGAGAIQAGGPLRRERRVHQAGARLLIQVARQTPGEAHVKRDGGDVGLMLLEVQTFEHHLLQNARKRALGLQAHRRQTAALLQDALHVLAVILVRLVGAFRRVEVGVARDADDIGVLDRVHAEHFGRDHLDGMLEQDELEAFARQLDDARGLARHGQNADGHPLGAKVLGLFACGRGRLDGFFDLLGFLPLVLLLALLRAYFLIKAHNDVQRPVFQVGEGVARVDDLRGKERHDVDTRVVGQKRALLVVEVGGAQVLDLVLGKLVAHVLVGAFLNRVQLVAARMDGGKLLGGGHARFRIEHLLLQKRQVGQAADAHHEELLQVRPEDADEVQALEQRNALVGALVEHALVEGEPGQLAVLHIR